MIRFASVAVSAALLAGCASGPRGPSNQAIDRMLARAPGEAQPSKIVSTELAFARMAREEGQWTAFREYAAPGAQIHGRNGPIEALPWLATLSDPAEPVQWAPRAVWMSCDGALAVSLGRFRDPEDKIGSFVTVWQRQRGDEYRYIYDAAGLDDPQPVPSEPDANQPEVDIVVTAMNSVEGHVADCPRSGLTRPEAPTAVIADGITSASRTSRDGTLRWRWEQEPAGDRRVVVDYLHEGTWEVAFDQLLPVSAE